MKVRNKLLLLLALFSIAIQPQAATHNPEVSPKGWVAANYTGSLVDYLKSEYAAAKEKGKTPYVYIYSDRSGQCQTVRRLMRRDDMQRAFSNTHIVMLDYFLIKQAVGHKFTEEFTPQIIQISESGKLTGQVMPPVIYLFYPTLSDDKTIAKFSTSRKWNGNIPYKIFAKKLEHFFETNNLKN